MIRVRGLSRLHFGLFGLPVDGVTHWPGPAGEPGIPIRHFGGVGAMLREPGIDLTIARSTAWQAVGPHAERALAFAQCYLKAASAEPAETYALTIRSAPEEHIGLGLGTQLAMSIARGLAVLRGEADLSPEESARRMGRGSRSAIGVHGSARGGFLIEGGKAVPEQLSPLLARVPLPADWRFLLVRPSNGDRWFGRRELQAFADLTQDRNYTAITTELARVALLGLLPALLEADFSTFALALSEFNRRSGELFAPIQGGVYSSATAFETIALLRRIGCRGVGQSSWGPTLFAICRDRDEADSLSDLIRRQRSDIEVVIATPANDGVQLHTDRVAAD